MKLAIFTSTSIGAANGKSGKKAAAASFKDFRALSRLQSPNVAARLVRLANGVEKAIKAYAPERFERARWLEEAVGQIVRERPNHVQSHELLRCLTRLLRQSFRSLDWRRPLIAGLAPARIGGSKKTLRVSSATS